MPVTFARFEKNRTSDELFGGGIIPRKAQYFGFAQQRKGISIRTIRKTTCPGGSIYF
jgi:hypothetical protein